MNSTVLFDNQSGQALMVESGPQNLAFDYYEDAYNNAFDGYGKLGLIDSYAMFFPGGDISRKPVYYFRHYDVANNYYRFGNFMDLGDDVLAPQNGVLHEGEVAGPETPVVRYHRVAESPSVYEYSSTEREVEYRFYRDKITIREGGFLDVVATPFPVAMYDHQSVYQNTGTVFQPLMYMGVMDGEPVVGLGEIERMFFSQNIKSFDSVPMGYICMSGVGIRHDGRKECALVSASINPLGKTFAYYFIEGEQPIISDVVEMTAEWEHLPCVDDGTCVFRNATFRFGGKTINFKGRWGTKGFQPKPRVERHGQSQAIGSWYEGEKPYEHRLYVGFAESMEAYDHVLESLGFTIR